ncbi:unnamed protein product [Musa banksii]
MRYCPARMVLHFKIHQEERKKNQLSVHGFSLALVLQTSQGVTGEGWSCQERSDEMYASKEKAVSVMLRWTDAAHVAMRDSYLSVEDEGRRKKRETFGVDTLHSMLKFQLVLTPCMSGGGC